MLKRRGVVGNEDVGAIEPEKAEASRHRHRRRRVVVLGLVLRTELRQSGFSRRYGILRHGQIPGKSLTVPMKSAREGRRRTGLLERVPPWWALMSRVTQDQLDSGFHSRRAFRRGYL